jgi:hypothetical protein
MTTTTTTTTTTSGEPATAAVEALVLTAYLKPLVDKHSANELITYEDLHAAHTAALAKIKLSGQPETTLPPLAETTMVRDKLRSLHQEQMDLYKAAAVAHIQAWAETTAVPTLSGEPPVVPNWKLVPKSVLEAAKQRVAERAAAVTAAAVTATAASTAEDSAMTEAATVAGKEDAVVDMEEATGEEGEVEGGGTNSDELDGEGTPVADESLENSTSDLPVSAAAEDESSPPVEEEKSSSKAAEGKAATTTTANKGKGGILAKSRARAAGRTTTTAATAPPAKKKPPPAKSPAPGGGGKRGGRGGAVRKARAAPSK